MAQQHVICVDNNTICKLRWVRGAAHVRPAVRAAARLGLVLGSVPTFLFCFFNLNIRLVSAAPCDMRFSVFLTSRYLFRPPTLPCPCSTLELTVRKLTKGSPTLPALLPPWPRALLPVTCSPAGPSAAALLLSTAESCPPWSCASRSWSVNRHRTRRTHPRVSALRRRSVRCCAAGLRGRSSSRRRPGPASGKTCHPARLRAWSGRWSRSGAARPPTRCAQGERIAPRHCGAIRSPWAPP